MDMLLLHFTPTYLTSFLFFLSVYLLAFHGVFRNWGQKQRIDASSSFMSLAHGTPAVILAIDSLFSSTTQSSSPLSFASPNTHLHNRVLEFSIGYFLMDLLHYLIFIPSDILFILHHLATLYVLATSRFVVRLGASEILVLLVLAEVTSCCQNVWSICRFRKDDSPTAARLYEFLSLPFFVFYSFVRGILGPVWGLKMAGFYLSGAGHGLVPVWAWVSWTVVSLTGIFVSILWISNHWRNWFRRRSQKEK